MPVVTAIVAALAVLCMGVGAWLAMAGMVFAFAERREPAWAWRSSVPFGVAVSAIGLLIYGASSIAVVRLLV